MLPARDIRSLSDFLIHPIYQKYTGRKMDIQDQYLNIQLCEKHFTVGCQIIMLTLFLLAALNLLILTIHLLKFFTENNIKDVKIMHKTTS